MNESYKKKYFNQSFLNTLNPLFFQDLIPIIPKQRANKGLIFEKNKSIFQIDRYCNWLFFLFNTKFSLRFLRNIKQRIPTYLSQNS